MFKIGFFLCLFISGCISLPRQQSDLPVVESDGPVTVSIVSARSQKQPSAWFIEYKILNTGTAPVWLVDGSLLSLRQTTREIELSLARAPMQPNVHVFGYFVPKTTELKPGASVTRLIEVPWPCPLSDIWNATREATPDPGKYAVSIRVGYGETSKPPAPSADESVEAPVLRWQRHTVSPPIPIELAPYTRAQ